MYEWFHDDITWCWDDCPYTDCERNRANRLSKTGLCSAAMFKGTDMCPHKDDLAKKENLGTEI